MKLFKHVNQLIDTLGLPPRQERPLDFHLTQADIEAELHYPGHDQADRPSEVRVTMLELAAEH